VPVPPEVVTDTVPVEPDPIVAIICVAVFVVIAETAVPPIVTLVAPERLVPLIVMEEPTHPFVAPNELITGGGTAVCCTVVVLLVLPVWQVAFLLQ
jgi:hypothetical protein